MKRIKNNAGIIGGIISTFTEIFLLVYSVYMCRNMAKSTSTSSASDDHPSTSEDFSDQVPDTA